MRRNDLKISFEDVQLVTALTQGTSVRRAQALLGGHVATLYRKLRDLESRAGGALFERQGDQLIPTSRALPFLEASDDLIERLAEIERRVAAQDDRLVGPLRITTADTLETMTCACLRDFAEQQPHVALTLEIANANVDLGRREADIAIRPTTSPPETLIGRRATHFHYGIYRRRGALNASWIGLTGPVAAIPAGRWLSANVADAEIGLRVNALGAAASAAAAGWGLALLPAYVAAEHDLERTSGPIRELESEIWILFHPDLKPNPRVRAFCKFAAEWFSRNCPRGEAAESSQEHASF